MIRVSHGSMFFSVDVMLQCIEYPRNIRLVCQKILQQKCILETTRIRGYRVVPWIRTDFDSIGSRRIVTHGAKKFFSNFD